MNADASFEWLLARLVPDPPRRLLDLGCGECREGPALVGAGVELTGLDADEHAIARARERTPGATFVCADAAALEPGWHEPFDVVLLRRPELAAALGAWERILWSIPWWLSRRGRVIVTTARAIEAELARAWLGQAGLAVDPAMRIGEPDERYVVTAARPASWAASVAARAGLVRDPTIELRAPALRATAVANRDGLLRKAG